MQQVNSLNVFVAVLQVCAANEEFWREVEDIRRLKMLSCVSVEMHRLLSPSGTMFPFCHLYSRAFRLHSWIEAHDWYNWKKNHAKHVQASNTRPAPRRGGHTTKLYKLSDVLEYLMQKAQRGGRDSDGGFGAYVHGLVKYRSWRKTHFKRMVTFYLASKQRK